MDEPGLFRLFSPQSPTTRQTTRTLQDLNERRVSGIFNLREMGNNLLQNQDNQVLRPNPNHTHTPPILRDNNVSGSENRLQDGHTPSPDEAVIQARGRRQVPLTFSPDVTPLRQQMQRAKLSNIQGANSRLSLPNIRLSPRKRLTLSDNPPSPQMYVLPPDITPISPLAKRIRLDDDSVVDPSVSVQGLSRPQLVQLVQDILRVNPDIRECVTHLLPTPDISVLEEQLNLHKKNIYKSLPNSRLESKTDSMAFNRVGVHLTSFRRVLSEGVKQLLAGEQWIALVEYTIMAWGYVQATPVWDNPSHNGTRKACFKTLASACLNALKYGNFSAVQRHEIREKLKKISPLSTELDVCLKHLGSLDKAGAEEN
ncbi:uncharacterized protein LOC111705248 [Eurytemora carolleeae]|uniref:uncharacterized protein LOC111705248 n=1 Tax=Eurytemora carolleeae TaxID=1294199 RepID=UPI000C77F1D3|nr:uncharacterized protein LOC111705248 [Eurytemora carolleeae]|eukprot:XP_023333508.1 uncharacterized protein LOC111705248 [Eurytemora affinis]